MADPNALTIVCVPIRRYNLRHLSSHGHSGPAFACTLTDSQWRAASLIAVHWDLVCLSSGIRLPKPPAELRYKLSANADRKCPPAATLSSDNESSMSPHEPSSSWYTAFASLLNTTLLAPSKSRTALGKCATFLVIWDSGASISLSPDRQDFVGPLNEPGTGLRLQGLVSGAKIAGKGHVLWAFKTLQECYAF
jgi:hypothetical protein